MSKIYFCICHICFICRHALHFKISLFDFHIIQKWHLFCLFTFWYDFYFYFRAPHWFFLSIVQQGVPHNGQRNIFLCDWILHGDQPWFTFQSAEMETFFFSHMGTFLSNNKGISLFLRVFYPLAGFVCAYYQVFPLFVLRTKADELFIYEKKGHLEECICCSVFITTYTLTCCVKPVLLILYIYILFYFNPSSPSY